MSAISLFNPFSSRYQALEDFSKLTLEQKIVTVALTVLASVASLFLATAAVFRALVGHFYTVIHPDKKSDREDLPGMLPILKSPKPLIGEPSGAPIKKHAKRKINKKPIPVESTARVDQKAKVEDSAAALEIKEVISPSLKKQVEKTRRRALSLDSSGVQIKRSWQKALDGEESAKRRVIAEIERTSGTGPSHAAGVEEDGAGIDASKDVKERKAQDSSSEDGSISVDTEITLSSGTGELDVSDETIDTTEQIEGDNEKQDLILSQLKGLGETSIEEKRMLDQAFQEEQETYRDDEGGEYIHPDMPVDTDDSISFEITSDALPSDLFASIAVKREDRKDLGLEEKHCNAVAYIMHYLDDLARTEENETKKIQDSDPIAFDNGMIVKAEDSTAAQKAYQQFYHILKETYGSRLAKSVFGRYRLFNQTAVTLKDIKKAMVAVASRVTEDDLRMLFEHIRHDPPGRLTSYRAGDLLCLIDRALYLNIKSKKSFYALTTAEINFLHSAFRTVPFSKLGYEGLDVLFHIKKDFVPKEELETVTDACDVKTKIRDAEIDDYESFLFGKDIDALILMESWKGLDLEHPELALGEWVGKSLAYLELKPGLILPMPMIRSQEGADVSVPKLYKVAKSLPHMNDAVIAHVIAPLNEHQAICPQEPEAPAEDVFLVFRGSMAGKNKDSGMTWVRDFHHKGVGRTTYDRREPEIQAMVEEYLKETAQERVTLRITGHSLGACDSQRGLVSILEKIAASEEGSPFRKVKRVVLTSFNAPKVNPTVNKRMKEAVRTINGKGIDVGIELTHLRFYDRSNEDHVQWGGDILLGADYHGGTGDSVFKDAANVKRTIVKVHMDEDKGLNPGGILARHSNRTFNRSLCSIKSRIETLSDDNEAERLLMEKEMAGNYYWNEGEMTEGQKIIGNITWYASLVALREPGKVLRAVFINLPHRTGLEVDRLCKRSIYAMLEEARTY